MAKGSNFGAAEHARRLQEHYNDRAAQVAANQARDARRERDQERVQKGR